MEKITTLAEDIEIPSNGKLTLEKINEDSGATYFRLTLIVKEHSFIIAGGSEAEIIEFSRHLTDSIKDFMVGANNSPK